jgi:hypothetical protein
MLSGFIFEKEGMKIPRRPPPRERLREKREREEKRT